MYGLPPPPKYPTHLLQPGPDGKPATIVETINTLKHPTGPEYQLVVGEGTYVLKDDLHLASPPPHPSEPPQFNPNPLATNAGAPTTGVKVTLVPTSSGHAAAAPARSSRVRVANAFGFGWATVKRDENKEKNKDVATTVTVEEQEPTVNGTKAPAFGAGNSLLTGEYEQQSPITRKGGSKKPKTTLGKSNSSYISRYIYPDSMQKRLQDRDKDGLFAFANISRAFVWLDLSSNDSIKADHITKLLFSKAHPLCHDINKTSQTSTNIDIIMGMSLGDMIWYEPFSAKYSRINKIGVINPSAVSQIGWIPGSENLFLASHIDGTLVVYDKEREDAPFVSEAGEGNRNANAIITPTDEKENAFDSLAVNTDVNLTNGGNGNFLQVNKSVNSRNQKFNPVASWNISNQKINSFAFSPDCRHLAVVSEDGSLRIIDYLAERLLDLYTSYYGGIICVCWSPDGKYILTGGQDDLVTIWSLEERRIVARCPGHKSWVTAVAFDAWRCEEGDYRFGSVGEDCRLLLWDFSVSMLQRPKHVAHTRRGGSVTSLVPSSRAHAESLTSLKLKSTQSLGSNAGGDASSIGSSDTVVTEHVVESRVSTAELPPVFSQVIDPDPLSWIAFQEDAILTACAEGHIRTWNRPREDGSPAMPVQSENAANTISISNITQVAVKA